jgi:DNA-binding Lrp family transcriptional regulator
MGGADEKDVAILQLLQRDSRSTYQLSSTNLAKFGIEISTVGVLKRVQRLVEKGVVLHFTVKTDPEKLGLTSPILILVRLRPKPIREFVKDIQCVELQGRENPLIPHLSPPIQPAIYGIWESKEEYGKWKSRLLTRLDSILETNELFILDSYKEQDNPAIQIPSHLEQELSQTKR